MDPTDQLMKCLMLWFFGWILTHWICRNPMGIPVNYQIHHSDVAHNLSCIQWCLIYLGHLSWLSNAELSTFRGSYQIPHVKMDVLDVMSSIYSKRWNSSNEQLHFTGVCSTDVFVIILYFFGDWDNKWFLHETNVFLQEMVATPFLSNYPTLRMKHVNAWMKPHLLQSCTSDFIGDEMTCFHRRNSSGAFAKRAKANVADT